MHSHDPESFLLWPVSHSLHFVLADVVSSVLFPALSLDLEAFIINMQVHNEK